jgi:hypothetical protein
MASAKKPGPVMMKSLKGQVHITVTALRAFIDVPGNASQ